jgi:sugar phosphate isomerase/epimerase
MKLGMMNNPRFELCGEIAWAKKNGFDYLDLTLEPPAFHAAKFKLPEVKGALREWGLGIVGHTAYYLPIASPYDSLRQAALEEMHWALRVFAELGASTVTIHPDKSIAFALSPKEVLQKNLESLEKIFRLAEPLGLRILIENMDRTFNNVEQIREALDRIPRLGFHLDVGHANLNVEQNRTAKFLQAFRERLAHVHFSDNFGKSEDLHLPLGAGNIPWSKIVGMLKDSGYDGTITLEIFSADRRYLLFSRDKVKELWGS